MGYIRACRHLLLVSVFVMLVPGPPQDAEALLLTAHNLRWLKKLFLQSQREIAAYDRPQKYRRSSYDTETGVGWEEWSGNMPKETGSKKSSGHVFSPWGGKRSSEPPRTQPTVAESAEKPREDELLLKAPSLSAGPAKHGYRNSTHLSTQQAPPRSRRALWRNAYRWPSAKLLHKSAYRWYNTKFTSPARMAQTAFSIAYRSSSRLTTPRSTHRTSMVGDYRNADTYSGNVWGRFSVTPAFHPAQKAARHYYRGQLRKNRQHASIYPRMSTRVRRLPERLKGDERGLMKDVARTVRKRGSSNTEHQISESHREADTET
ncbi:hypothetical protein BaRGS_00027801, partial [Batillaria attramentaria]